MTQAEARRLQVLLVPEWYPTDDDQVAGSFVRDQAHAVCELNDVVVALDGPVGPFGIGNVFHDGPVSVFEVGRRRLPGPLNVLSRAIALRRFISSLPVPPDVIHAHVYASGFVSVLAASGMGIPVVLSEHTSDFVEGLVGGRASVPAHFALRRSALVCPVSDGLMRAMASFEPRAVYEVVPNVVVTESFRNQRVRGRRQADAPVRLLSVGIMARQKGFSHLISAAGALASSGVPFELELVGDGPLRADLERRAASLLPPGSFRFLGPLPREEVAERMAEADIYVMSSVVETFGVALVEALAAGLPVVATDVGIARSVVGEDEGVLVAPADDHALAAGIEAVMSGLERFSDEAGDHSVIERFSAEAVGRKWDEVYRRVARS